MELELIRAIVADSKEMSEQKLFFKHIELLRKYAFQFVVQFNARAITLYNDPAESRRELLKDVCRCFGIKEDVIKGDFRDGDIVIVRHLYVYLALTMQVGSTVNIGKQLGNRDHSTIINANQRFTYSLIKGYPKHLNIYGKWLKYGNPIFTQFFNTPKIINEATA